MEVSDDPHVHEEVSPQEEATEDPERPSEASPQDDESGVLQETPRLRKHSRAWKWPWVVVFLSLGMFTLPWIYVSIIERYLIQHNFHTLAGLDKTLARRVFLVSHMLAGSVALLTGPTQFYAPLRDAYPGVHRWMGRFYVFATCMASVCGLVFCCLKGFILSGGLNMGLAFVAAGSVFGAFGFMVYYKAAIQQDWAGHRAYAVRSYCQVLAPMLYRYWYTLLIVLGLYNPEKYHNAGCHEDTGLCDEFLQTFDMIHCWTYWLTSLAVGELIVWALPPMKPSSSLRVNSDVLYEPILEEDIFNHERPSAADDDNNDDPDAPGLDTILSSEDTLSTTSRQADQPYRDLNYIGVVLAGITLGVTATIFKSA